MRYCVRRAIHIVCTVHSARVPSGSTLRCQVTECAKRRQIAHDIPVVTVHILTTKACRGRQVPPFLVSIMTDFCYIYSCRDTSTRGYQRTDLKTRIGCTATMKWRVERHTPPIRGPGYSYTGNIIIDSISILIKAEHPGITGH